MTPPKGGAVAEEPRDLPSLPVEAGAGVTCSCGEAWWTALVAIDPYYTALLVVEPVCASCGAPAPPMIERYYRSPKVQ